MKNSKTILVLLTILILTIANGSFASESNPEALLSSLDRKFISVYKTVVPKEGAFDADYPEEVARLPNLTFGKLLRSANFGFEGDSVAYEIETENKIKGWVSLDQVWFPTKVVRMKDGDTLNVRERESLDSKIADSVRQNEILYGNAIVLIQLGTKGYDPADWARVSTKRGNHGFVKLRYFEIIETNVKPYP
ncbi:hypothetical protein [Leptospira stimsonii]|uniref:SH3b domain-containing protein n=1 Tax=Leptospira stimsonii TaxID=2202203 RepID=A0A396ZGI3_9LEPT|nr:hypothetical protein [Leptospira stimsonii]RHX93034.1 hypothetical protein DLM75_07765 [Leptospira stimsonii]